MSKICGAGSSGLEFVIRSPGGTLSFGAAADGGLMIRGSLQGVVFEMKGPEEVTRNLAIFLTEYMDHEEKAPENDFYKEGQG